RLPGATSGALAGALVTGAAFGLTNSPLALAPSATWYWLVFGASLRLLAAPGDEPVRTPWTVRRAPIVVAVIAASVACWWLARTSVHVPAAPGLDRAVDMNRGGTHLAFTL